MNSRTAWLPFPSASSIQRPRFPGVTSDLKPTVCCPCEVTSQILGPGLWLRKHDLMACLCAASWMCSRMFPGHLRFNKAQFSKPPPISKFSFPPFSCLSPWIHLSSCHPQKKCGQQHGLSLLPTPSQPCTSQSGSPRDPVSKPCSRLGLSLHLHPHTDHLLFPLHPVLNFSSIPGPCMCPSFVQPTGPLADPRLALLLP